MLNFHQALQAADFYKKVIIKDMLCVEYKCLDQRDYFDFWTDCGCLVFCTAGKKLYRSNTADIEVAPGSIFYLKKGAYTGKNYLGDQYCALIFFMPDHFIQDFLLTYPHLEKLADQIADAWIDGIIPIESDPALESYFFSFLHYFSHVADIKKEILAIKIKELLLTLFTQEQHHSIAIYLSSLAQDRYWNFNYLIEENYASNMKLEEYAQLCMMSLSTFKREFLKRYGEPPGKWLLKRKLQLAARLLRQSDKIINEISFQCGFESPSHFIRVFKKRYGSTPLKYRAQKSTSASGS